MDNSSIAEILKLTGKLMDLHDENPFKIKSFLNASFKIDKITEPLTGKTKEEIEKIDGIGKSIASKIFELLTTGSHEELELLLKITPKGVIDLFTVKGLGPKKIKVLWNELEIESLGELYYACQENRLLTLKGFGTKTQDEIKKYLEFKISNSGKVLFSIGEAFAEKIILELKTIYNPKIIETTGQLARSEEVIDKIELLGSEELQNVDCDKISKNYGIEFMIHQTNTIQYPLDQIKFSSTEEHWNALISIGLSTNEKYADGQDLYSSLNIQYIEPELRENEAIVKLAKTNQIPQLIELDNLKGVLHNHTTYSDGANTLKEMANYCKKLGYEYLGICDHSKTAAYAGGLKVEQVYKQWEEIDLLNKSLAPFKIFKGIESDILADGSLDYDEEILKGFDLIVASVHQGLKMDEAKATTRLLKAIENPYTTILGHATGRLLLSRPSYPIDHKKIIDACASNRVSIELNANPHRLDLDWRWIPYCFEKGVLISINPDAHHIKGYHDMYYGIKAARKGMLSKEFCLNSMSLSEFENWLSKK